MAFELPIQVKALVEDAKKGLGDVKKGVLDVKAAQKEQGAYAKVLHDAEKKAIYESGDALKVVRHRYAEVTEEINRQREAQAKANEKTKEMFDRLRLGAGAISGKLGGVLSLTGGLVTGGTTGIIEAGITLFEKGVEFIKEAGRFTVEKATELYKAGKEDYDLKQKLIRQYGADRAEGILGRAGLAGERAGIEQSSATAGMVRILEAMPTIAKGTIVSAELAKQLGLRGGRQAIDEGTAERLRGQMEERRAKVFERFMTLRPGADPKMIGDVVGSMFTAGSGGARKFAMAMDLPRMAAKIIAANEAGKVANAPGIGSADLVPFKDKIKGGKLAEGDLIDLLSRKYGLGEDAAQAARSKLEFQIQSIKATLGDVFSDVGQQVYENLNGPLAKGKTLAQQFTDYIKSPEGKAAVKEIADDLASAARFLGEMVRNIPAFIAGIKEGVGVFRSAGAFVGKAGGFVSDLAAGGSKGAVSSAWGAATAGPEDARSQATRNVGEMLAKRFGNDTASKIDVGGIALHVGVGVGDDAATIVSKMMPEIERQLIDLLRRQTAHGAAPASPY